MRNATITMLLALSLLATAVPSAWATDPPRLTGPPGASANKVLVIGTDGTRIDLVDRLAAEGAVPNLADIMATGFSVPSLLAYAPPEALTISEVGWSSIATGVWPAKHGVRGYFINNDPGQSTKNGYLDFLSRVERERPRLSTFLASDWANIGMHQNGGPIFGDAIDARWAIAAGDTIAGYDGSDQQIADVAARYLREGSPDAGFVYFGVVDETAHLAGSATARYLQAIRDTDRRIGQLLDAIRARPTYLAERWLVIVTTDHGQQNLHFPFKASHGLGSDLERMSFVAATGFGLGNSPRFGDIRVVDIAPTVLTYLGIPVTPSLRLDGRTFASTPSAPAPTITVRRVRENWLRVLVRAHAGAPAIKSVRIRIPERFDAHPVTAAPSEKLTTTRHTVRLTTHGARRVSLVIAVRGNARRSPGRLRVSIIDVNGGMTIVRPRGTGQSRQRR